MLSIRNNRVFFLPNCTYFYSVSFSFSALAPIDALLGSMAEILLGSFSICCNAEFNRFALVFVEPLPSSAVWPGLVLDFPVPALFPRMKTGTCFRAGPWGAVAPSVTACQPLLAAMPDAQGQKRGSLPASCCGWGVRERLSGAAGVSPTLASQPCLLSPASLSCEKQIPWPGFESILPGSQSLPECC